MPAISPCFQGLWIPLVTPFTPLQSAQPPVDVAAVKRLALRLKHDGVAGLVVCGSTGEAAALSAPEQLAVLDTVLDAVGDLPVVMGVSGYHLPDMLAWVRTLTQRRLAGLLVPAPHYIRPGQAGVLHWFRTIADASPVPLIVYDIPYRTGTTIDRPTMLALAAHPNIHAVKDCGGDAGKTLALLADGRLDVLAGEDLQMFATIAQGGTGAIAASAHLRTRDFVALIDDLRQGRMEAARETWHSLTPQIEAAFAQPNPAPVKAWLADAGEIGGALRAPMMPAELSRP